MKDEPFNRLYHIYIIYVYKKGPQVSVLGPIPEVPKLQKAQTENLFKGCVGQMQ